LIRTYKPGLDNNISINDMTAESEAGKKIKKKKKDKKDKKSKENKVKIVFRGDGDSIVKHIINDTINSLKNERNKKIK